MAVLTVNGTVVSVNKNQQLLRFLRDTLHLTSVKDGCSEGACGTCTVLVDGKATKACVPQTDKLEGKTILTVEGLSQWEKDAFTWAFGEAGAVQCGFCIPGMIMSAEYLLENNPDMPHPPSQFEEAHPEHIEDLEASMIAVFPSVSIIFAICCIFVSSFSSVNRENILILSRRLLSARQRRR